MAKRGTKVSINNEIEKAELIDIKDGETEKEKELAEEKRVLEEKLEKFYQQGPTFERPVRKNVSLWLLIFLAVLFGLISGAMGSLFILSREKVDLPFFKEINLTKYFPTREITLVTEKKITVTEEQRLAEVMKVVQPSVVRIYLAKPKPASFFESFYQETDALGLGVVLTTDGWLLTTSSVITDPTKTYLAASTENKIFNVEKIIYDSLTGFVFLKTNLSNMPVAKIADLASLNSGQKVFLFDKGWSLAQSQLVNLTIKPNRESLIQSTEKLPFYFALQEKIGPSYLGSPVFALDKSLIGLINSSNFLTPAFYLNNILPQILEREQISRPYLGLEYLDLQDLVGLNDPRYQGFSSGAIVYSLPSLKTPAAKAGLKNGDLIIKVDGLPFSGRANLTELVQSKRPGEKIELTVIRDGKELILTAVLASI